MNRYFAYALAFAALAIVSACAPSVQTSIQPIPAVAEFETKIRFANSDVPLPPGKWELAAAGGTLVNNAYYSFPAETTSVSLVQIENGTLKGIVTISAAPGISASKPIWDRDCDRTDLLFVEVDRRYAAPDQSCLHITHFTRHWALSGTEDAKQFNTYLVKRSITLPMLMLRTDIHHVENGEFIHVAYEVSPPAFGGPDVPNFYGMVMLGWHPQIVNTRPPFRAFAQAWIEWSKVMATQVKAGFGRTLNDFKPIAINRIDRVSPLPAAPTTGAFRAPVAGTRFITNDGRHFEIAHIDGMMVSTLNAENQSGEWFAGGIVPLSTSPNFDRTLVASAFPLTVGKNIDFIRFADTVRNVRRYNLDVVRIEELVVDRQAYTAYVVEIKYATWGPDIGEVQHRQTVWYAPSVGWLLRYRSERLVGPKQDPVNWEVVRIVPPGG